VKIRKDKNHTRLSGCAALKPPGKPLRFAAKAARGSVRRGRSAALHSRADKSSRLPFGNRLRKYHRTDSIGEERFAYRELSAIGAKILFILVEEVFMFIKMFKNIREKYVEESEDKAYEIKDKYMESILGEEYEKVMHALISFSVGGSLDLYYYPNYCNGTAIATKELTNYKFNKPKNDAYDAYELVMVTKHKINLESMKEENILSDTFAYDHKYINGILNCIARYSTEAKLNPHETIEFPEEMEDIGGKCLILDILSEPLCTNETRNKKFGLMLLMEIHRDEMEYAMQQNGKELIIKLKEKGVYPYTGINRPSVL
jgi:hypothetical protein